MRSGLSRGAPLPWAAAGRAGVSAPALAVGRCHLAVSPPGPLPRQTAFWDQTLDGSPSSRHGCTRRGSGRDVARGAGSGQMSPDGPSGGPPDPAPGRFRRPRGGCHFTLQSETLVRPPPRNCQVCALLPVPPPVSGGACSSSGVFVSFLLAWRGGSLLWRRRGRRGLGAAGAPSHVPQPPVAQGWCRLPRRPGVACGAEPARIWARRGGVRGSRPPGALLRKPHPGQGATSCRRSGREARFALSALRFGSRQNSASCDLLGNFPDDYIKVPPKTQAPEGGGAPSQPVSWGASPRGVRGTEARSWDDPRGPAAKAGGVTGGLQGLHIQPGHSLRGHPLRPNVPSSPDHVPAARLPLGRAFPKGRAAGRPQGRWAQESWGPGGRGLGGRGLGGRGAGGHNGRLRPPTGPAGHGCRRPRPLGQPGVRRTMALSSWVFRRPRLSLAIPGASVETGGWGPFQAGRLCHRFVRPCGGDNTGHLPFHPLDKARDGSRAMAVTVRPLSIWALEGSPGSKEAAPRPHTGSTPSQAPRQPAP